MLEKLAEMVREEAERTGATEEFPACMACDFAPKNSRVCKNRWCVNPSWDEGSLMLARWAVLLVAKALPSWEEYEKAGIEYEGAVKEMDEVICARHKAFERWAELDGMVMTELLNLIAEAKEGTHDAV